MMSIAASCDSFDALPAAGGVVVTYFPDSDFDRRLAIMAREAAPFVVVDNSGDPAVRSRLSKLCAPLGCTTVFHAANLGIGAALNTGFDELARRGIPWAVAFDQDSLPYEGCVARLQRTAQAHPRAVVIGCNWRDEAHPQKPSRYLVSKAGFRPWFKRSPADRDMQAACIITSGSLFNLREWRSLGGFRADLFLDLVDTEYCLRATAAGWNVVVAANAHLLHRRGEKRFVQRFGRTWSPAFVPPTRVYLMARNGVYLILRHGWMRFPWAVFEICHLNWVLFSALVLEHQSLDKCSAFVRGLFDGVRGHLGPPVR